MVPSAATSGAPELPVARARRARGRPAGRAAPAAADAASMRRRVFTGSAAEWPSRRTNRCGEPGPGRGRTAPAGAHGEQRQVRLPVDGEDPRANGAAAVRAHAHLADLPGSRSAPHHASVAGVDARSHSRRAAARLQQHVDDRRPGRDGPAQGARQGEDGRGDGEHNDGRRCSPHRAASTSPHHQPRLLSRVARASRLFTLSSSSSASRPSPRGAGRRS